MMSKIEKAIKNSPDIKWMYQEADKLGRSKEMGGYYNQFMQCNRIQDTLKKDRFFEFAIDDHVNAVYEAANLAYEEILSKEKQGKIDDTQKIIRTELENICDSYSETLQKSWEDLSDKSELAS